MKLALYLRISNQDDSAEDMESQSITGQRLLLENYIKTNPEFAEREVETFIDDGYSGTNFHRPGIEGLLKMVEDNLVDTIICKDFSRLGRNHIEIGDLMDNLFPLKNIRLISVNDGYDSKGAKDDIFVVFKNIINELYSKDISVKITSARKTGAKMGKFVTSFAPYGFKKNKRDKSKLEIDQECADIVGRIYQLALAGMGKTDIARLLNSENIPSPITIRRQRGDNFKNRGENPACFWTASTVSAILSDVRYTGDLVYGKVKPADIGSGKDMKVPKDEWIVTPNAHAAIISKADFNAVQTMKKKHNYKRSTDKNPLIGKVFCKECNHALTQSNRNKVGDFNFKCRTVTTDKFPCFKGNLPVKTLENVIITTLNLYLSLLDKQEDFAQSSMGKEEDFQGKIKLLENKQRVLKRVRLEIYEEFKKEKLTKEDFLKLKSDTAIEFEKNSKELETLKQQLAENIKADIASKIAEISKAPAPFTTVTKALVDIFIDKIYINKWGTIDILWKFNNSF